MPESLFISDLHLDPERPEVTRLFHAFLERRAPQAEGLYVLGDLFEVWLGDDDESPFPNEICAALRALAARGTSVHLLGGNRDFLLGPAFAHRCEATLLPEPMVLDLHGTRTVILHGDSLCTDDVEYQQFRAQVRNPVWQRGFLGLPLAERWRMAQEVRAVSRENARNKPMEIMDVNRDAVRALFEARGVTRMIHGHTHRPARHEHDTAAGRAERWVLGDWHDTARILAVDAGGCRLESIGPV